MERRDHWGWEDAAPSPPPQKEAVENRRQEIPPDVSTGIGGGRLSLHSDRRSAFAQAVFPYDPTKYRNQSEWRKEVGKRVSNDIHQHPDLCQRMYQAGYRPRVTGYTEQQIQILINFYKQKGIL